MRLTDKTNYLVIGSGIAGLSLAIKLAEEFPKRKITIVTKTETEESNTKYAQGGIAVVLNKKEDSFEKHIHDTLVAGDGLCDEQVVKHVILEGPKCFKTLLDWGSDFDKTKEGSFDLGKEGGHSENRIAHHKDITGLEIEHTLLKKISSLENINILRHHFALELIIDIVEGNTMCCGISVLNTNTNNIEFILADSTTLATGGIGQIYGHTTNPEVATGDGIAIASRAGVDISNMEFIQFHPTALYENKKGSSFLISEAVRGFGAYLKTKNGKRFMFQYDDRGELASRDIVSQGIYKTLTNSGDQCVFLDCTHLDINAFRSHFPNIYTYCMDKGIDISKDWIPVTPASHYLCGGINVNIHGQTSLQNLFACGECSNTGLHGANRLASNSLLEALVYAQNIFNYHKHFNLQPHYKIISNSISPKYSNLTSISKVNHLKKDVQQLMVKRAGIIRNNKSLQRGFRELKGIQNQLNDIYNNQIINTEILELRNMIEVAFLILKQSINRKENRGGFYKTHHSTSIQVNLNKI